MGYYYCPRGYCYLSKGAIVGIVIGGLVLTILVSLAIMLILYLIEQRRLRRITYDTSTSSA
jgi:hypothetical protein